MNLGFQKKRFLQDYKKKLNISLAEAQEYSKKVRQEKRGKVNQKIPMQKKMVKI